MMRSRFAVLAILALNLFSHDSSAANLMRGQQLFQMHCAACHGLRGEGVLPEAPKFQQGQRLEQPDMLLMQSIKTGKNKMPAFFGILKDQEILDVLGYVRTLR